jgi:micrococcal nuclease|tara:strand:- start:308 stop:703 length:396 start_codon:yes stop_codon:yes gene_type:complete
MYEYAVKKIVKIVDGDTIDIEIDLGFSLTKKERVRLAGIDTPESRTRDLDEKAEGLLAKSFLEKQLDEAVDLRVKTEKDGKYGRMLGWLHDGNKNINKYMVLKGYAWEYDGGKKEKNLDDLRRIRGTSEDG